jgi:cell division protein FtsI (penicillin-binding protein 3)
MNIKGSILIRARIAFLVMFMFALAVVYRIIILQFVEGEQWSEISRKVSLQYKTVSATRGNIFSDNGSLLATSVPYYRVAMDPTRPSNEVFQKEIDSLALKLARTFREKSPQEYKREITNARVTGRKYIFLTRDEIDYQEKKKMEEWPVFRYGRLDGGVIFEKVDKRFMPFSYLAYRTIGYINENNEGAGLEYSFNNYLAGKDGEALFQKISGGSWKPVPDAHSLRPSEGYDIETTIDVNLQDVAQAALLKSLSAHHADYGALIVMEVKTGEIKAMSNLSRTANGKYAELYNYAMGRHGLREPGSTFKLATMIALLEETDIKLEDTIQTGKGTYKIYNETVRDHEEGGFGTISIQKSFEVSSNIAMAKLAEKYFTSKPSKFFEYLKQLHLTEPLGFQMEGEGKPVVKEPKDWSGITLPWMAHGYGLELTPIHTLTLYNAVANNGTMIKPIIVKSIQKADKVKEKFESEILVKKICSDKTLNKLRILLEGVVNSGTASNIKNSHYQIAGKTGTAQLLRNGRHSRNYMTSFVGYFPAEAPLYSAIVIIENPKGFWQYGSNVAAPVFKEVADKIFASRIEMHDPIPKEYRAELGVFPVIQAGYKADLELICNELGISNHSKTNDEWVRAARNSNSVDWVSDKVTKALVPNVTGMTLRDALFLLENKGMQVEFKGKGRVTKQSEIPGKKISKGDKILLTLGS